MPNSSLRVLLVLPGPDLETARAAFRDGAPRIRIRAVGTLAEARAAIAGRGVDAVLGDLVLPDGQLTDLLGPRPELPLIVLVEQGQQRRALDALDRGALEWATKTPSLYAALPWITLSAVREWREHGRRRAAEEQLRHADRLATVGRVAAGVIHEVGTPLNVIRMRAQLLQLAPEEALDAASLIIEQCDRITAILRHTLNLARTQAAGMQPMDLLELARRAASLMNPSYRRRHAWLTVAPDSEAALVRGDPGRLLQVVLNLLTNALDALPEEGGRAVIRVVHDGDEAVLEVRDDGCGIPPELHPHLFSPFFTTKDADQGTGLGLAVSADIVAEHGGAITLESTPGEGSAFTVRLPALA